MYTMRASEELRAWKSLLILPWFSTRYLNHLPQLFALHHLKDDGHWRHQVTTHHGGGTGCIASKDSFHQRIMFLAFSRKGFFGKHCLFQPKVPVALRLIEQIGTRLE
ncbi:hypothetical protein D3C76_1215340 [compost metagenome]